MPLESLSATVASQHLAGLSALLRDAVESGASIGFLPPFTDDIAEAYWHGIFADVAGGSHRLLVWLEDGRVAGTVQLELAMKPNGRHRAEVQKLLVHRDYRRKGIGEALMQAVEATAQDANRSLLVLDTRQGDTAERLYRRLGWTEAGVIPHFALNETGTADATVIFYKTISA